MWWYTAVASFATSIVGYVLGRWDNRDKGN